MKCYATFERGKKTEQDSSKDKAKDSFRLGLEIM